MVDWREPGPLGAAWRRRAGYVDSYRPLRPDRDEAGARNSGEDADAFDDLWNRVRADLSPVGPIEDLLVERAINAMWRLRRSSRAETALFHWRVYWLKATRLREQVRSYERDFLHGAGFSTITDEAAHSEAMEALAEVESERDRDEVLLGCAFAKAADTFSKLARYERSIERSFLRNLDELRQLQNKRKNRPSSSISDAVTLDANDTQ